MSDLNRFTGLVRRCVEDYKMVEEGDRIAVGVSGGKDSVALLNALANLRGYYPKKFELIAISVDLGFEGFDLTQNSYTFTLSIVASFLAKYMCSNIQLFLTGL